MKILFLQALCRDIFNLDQRENAEFQDLGSSKAKPSADGDDDEIENIKIDQNQCFENHWFHFENDITEEDLRKDIQDS